MILLAVLLGGLLTIVLVAALLAVLLAGLPDLPRSPLSVWGPPLGLVAPFQALATAAAGYVVLVEAGGMAAPAKTALTALVAGTPAGIAIGGLYALMAFSIGLAGPAVRRRAPWLWPSAAVGMGLSATMLAAAFLGFVALRGLFPE